MHYNVFCEKFPSLGRYVKLLTETEPEDVPFFKEIVDWVEPSPELEELFSKMSDQQIQAITIGENHIEQLDAFLDEQPLFSAWFDECFGYEEE